MADGLAQVDGGNDISSNDDIASNNETDERINDQCVAENCANFLFTNARSLAPKLCALTQAFESLGLHGAGITETWFKGGKELNKKLNELEDSEGIRVIHRSRDERKKKTGGGVAFAFCTGTCNFKQITLKSAVREQEVMAVVGKVAKLKKKVVVFVVYIPPNTRAAEVEATRNMLVHEIAAARATYGDPVIIVGGDLACWDWRPMRECSGVDDMATALEDAIATLTEKHFPLARVRRRSNEDPWINRKIRRLWKKKVRVYKKEGKSGRWWQIDADLQEEIAYSKSEFVDRLLEEGNAGKSFYAATRKLSAAKTQKSWTVTDLFVGMSEGQVAEEVLSYFGSKARSDRPGVPDLPRTPGGLEEFIAARTAELLKKSKKTNSVVDGDPIPGLFRDYPDQFALPVSLIFNRINNDGRWPSQWKREHLTIIPKILNPTSLSECRNISCTSAFSKILENQVLLKLKGELRPDPSQYGGIKGCSVDHMLVDMWEDILDGMEGGKTAAMLLGVDYEKAFNRMEHAECVRQLRRLGASEGSISLVRAFLEDRAMSITINGVKSRPVKITRGSPQGSVLGCLLYCVTTQSLTKGLRERSLAPGAFLYVDDTTLFDCQDFANATLHLTTGTSRAHFQGLPLERDLGELSERAEDIGMRINEKKTQLLIIGPPNGYLHSGSVVGPGGETINSVDTMWLVSFTFGSDPSVGAHVSSIVEKFKRNVWMLYHLRDAGFRGRQLYRLYCCYVRTIIEYCSVVYHSMLGAGQETTLEGLHRLAIKISFGFDVPTDETMAENGIESLKDRRIRRCDSFLKKAIRNPMFECWFPPRDGKRRNLRRRRETQESRATTNRKFNSPLEYLRRRANELSFEAPVGEAARA